MVTVRTAKSKGSSFEYDTQYSLSAVYTDIFRTSERGFQQQYDLRSDEYKVVIECKRLKGISWNQTFKYFTKLIKVAPEGYESYVVFKSNNQPALVMSKAFISDTEWFPVISEFKQCFGMDFVKHESTRNKRG